MKSAKTSCGVIIGDGERLLLGHATRSPRWDIPKGEAEPGEDFAQAAARELREETGLSVTPGQLIPLGVHTYLRNKDLALFAWAPPTFPDPTSLVCTSTFALPNGTLLPEFDRFALFSWDEALTRIGRSMARVLNEIGPSALRRASK